jgi:hypothetical protein
VIKKKGPGAASAKLLCQCTICLHHCSTLHHIYHDGRRAKIDGKYVSCRDVVLQWNGWFLHGYSSVLTLAPTSDMPLFRSVTQCHRPHLDIRSSAQAWSWFTTCHFCKTPTRHWSASVTNHYFSPFLTQHGFHQKNLLSTLRDGM